jgi:adenosine deaminase
MPNVVLHDHLDGSLRVTTVIELADGIGHHLPETEPALLADWFDQSESGSLERYLRAFDHTIALLQTADAIARVARESILDLAADGAVYAELRFAPLLSTRRGLAPEDIIEAALGGIAEGCAESGIVGGLIVDALRSEPGSEEAARAAARFAGGGVVGFDLAGPEAGYPPEDHLPAIDLARAAGLGITLHAGESAGVASVAAALRCGADRLGHGIEIVDDCIVERGEIVGLGPVATEVHRRRIPLEVCPTSNLATKPMLAADHPVGMLHRAGFAVTINTDNRLMSRTSMSRELDLVRVHHGFTVADLAAVTRTAVLSGFHPAAPALWQERLAPAYAALR